MCGKRQKVSQQLHKPCSGEIFISPEKDFKQAWIFFNQDVFENDVKQTFFLADISSVIQRQQCLSRMCQLESVHPLVLSASGFFFFFSSFFLEKTETLRYFQTPCLSGLVEYSLKGTDTLAVQKLPLRLPGIIWLTGSEESG